MWYNLVVFSPVLIVIILIIFIYSTYIGTYLYVLLAYNNELITEKIYPFYTSIKSIKGSYTKGLILLSMTLFLLIFFSIAFFRTVFMDPGYFENPINFEKKLLELNAPKKFKKYFNRSESKKEKINNDKNEGLIGEEDEKKVDDGFWLIINDKIVNGPLTEKEYSEFRLLISTHYSDEDVERKTAISMDDGRNTATSVVEFEDNKKKSIDVEDVWSNFTNINLTILSLCSSCYRWKVDRSHHCRQCNRCVLKMDHHCPWLANCIGFRNYKYFCLIHFYGVMLTTIVSITFLEAVVGVCFSFTSSFGECFLAVFVYVLNLCLLGFLIWLFVSNIKLVFSGQTIIEQNEAERFPLTKKENLYDFGYYKNFTIVFGTNPLVWFLPFFANYQCEGMIYEKKEPKIDRDDPLLSVKSQSNVKDHKV